MKDLSWEVLFFVQGELDSRFPYRLKNSTACHEGWFTLEELEYKARNSWVCVSTEVHGSKYSEMISAWGCTVISVKFGDDIETVVRKVEAIIESKNSK